MNMLDYIQWRGDLTLEHAPLTRVDSLIMANLSYNPLTEADWNCGPYTLEELGELINLWDLTGNVYFQQWRELFYLMTRAPRYRHMLVCDYVDWHDDALGIQFSAESIDCRNGIRYIAYRGTDSSIVGWEEDFRMAFESPVPAQEAAVRYLIHEAGKCRDALVLVGHSKGGCLAAYAAACVPKEVQDRILKVYSFDGPGLSEQVMSSEGYARIQPRIESVIPQESVVGLLLDYHSDYTVVHSTSMGITQHDSFSWQLTGPDAYETMPETDDASQAINKGLHSWLAACTVEQRRDFTQALFEMLRSTNAETLPEIRKGGLKTSMAIVNTYRRMDPENRKAFEQVTGRLFGKVALSLWDQGMENVGDVVDRLRENNQDRFTAARENTQDFIDNLRENPVVENLIEKPLGALVDTVQNLKNRKQEKQAEEQPPRFLELPVQEKTQEDAAEAPEVTAEYASEPITIELPVSEPTHKEDDSPVIVHVEGVPDLIYGAKDEPVQPRKADSIGDAAKGIFDMLSGKKKND